MTTYDRNSDQKSSNYPTNIRCKRRYTKTELENMQIKEREDALTGLWRRQLKNDLEYNELWELWETISGKHSVLYRERTDKDTTTTYTSLEFVVFNPKGGLSRLEEIAQHHYRMWPETAHKPKAIPFIEYFVKTTNSRIEHGVLPLVDRLIFHPIYPKKRGRPLKADEYAWHA